jgi:hypothetical protein
LDGVEGRRLGIAAVPPTQFIGGDEALPFCTLIASSGHFIICAFGALLLSTCGSMAELFSHLPHGLARPMRCFLMQAAMPVVEQPVAWATTNHRVGVIISLAL